MRRIKYLLLFLAIVLASASLRSVVAQNGREPAAPKYVPVTAYDPKRDAAADIQEAIKEAQRTHKRILLEVGGEWCSWCHTLDRYFETNPELLLLRANNFVTLKINFSEGHENRELLSGYPEIAGYPHLFVLDSDGKLLRSQDTGALESGRSYNLEKLTAFLKEWAPAR